MSKRKRRPSRAKSRAKRKREKARRAPQQALLARSRAEMRATLQGWLTTTGAHGIPIFDGNHDRIVSPALQTLAENVEVPIELELLVEQLRDAVAQAEVNGMPSLKRDGDGDMPLRFQAAAADRRRAIGAAQALEFEIGPILAHYTDGVLLRITNNELNAWYEAGTLSNFAGWYQAAATPRVELAPSVALYALLDTVRAAVARASDPDRALHVLEHDIAGKLKAIELGGGLQPAFARYASLLVKVYVASAALVRERSATALVNNTFVPVGVVTRVTCQLNSTRGPFRTRRILIASVPPADAADWEIHGIYCDAGPNQLVSRLPGELFSTRATDSMIFVPIAHDRVELDVVYVGPNPVGMAFRAALIGSEFFHASPTDPASAADAGLGAFIRQL